MMGQVFVVSAPSGAGKSTICGAVRQDMPGLVYSVSYTTRSPRGDERNGVDYHFIPVDRFRDMIRSGEFLEWAEVYNGRFYGTGRSQVERQLALGRDVLVEIDVEGARQIRDTLPQAVFVFIITPDFRELARRLRGRHTEDENQIRERLGRARKEIEARTMYDYVIVNDDLDTAVGDMKSIIRSERLRSRYREDFWSGFFNEPFSEPD